MIQQKWRLSGGGELELRLQIPDDIIKKLQAILGSNVKATDIARDALTLFNWAVDERTRGRLVLSSDEDGEKLTRLAMPSLEQISQRKPVEKSAKAGVS